MKISFWWYGAFTCVPTLLGGALASLFFPPPSEKPTIFGWGPNERAEGCRRRPRVGHFLDRATRGRRTGGGPEALGGLLSKDGPCASDERVGMEGRSTPR